MAERSELTSSPDEVASACSHGCDEPMAIRQRSHDSAFDKECREFWKAVFLVQCSFPGCLIAGLAEVADDCLEEFVKRFGETAHAQGIKGENTCEGTDA